MSEVLETQGITKPPPEECANAASAGQMAALKALVQEAFKPAQ
jgi:hypothetical protein